MTRRGVNIMFAALAALALALPVAARDDLAKPSRPIVKARMDLPNAATIEGKQLKPGSYIVTADDSKVTLSLGGKVVAEAPVEWKGENGKSPYTSFVVESNQIKELHFDGKTRYIVISQ